MAAISRVGEITNGVLKDLVLRSAFARDQGWWDKVTSEFKITERYYKFDSVGQDGEAMGVDHLIALPIDRALDLCGFDVTHQNLGLNFLDLMHLDVDTFMQVEDWVHNYVREQKKRMSKDLKDELKGK